MAEVTDGIYIGSLMTATDNDFLRRARITHIFNLSGVVYASPAPVFYCAMADELITSATARDYLRKFSRCAYEMRAVHAMPHARMLVHCAAGINRSATLIAFYLINRGVPFERAVGLLEAANKARGVPLLTNPTFRELLRKCDRRMAQKEPREPLDSL